MTKRYYYTCPIKAAYMAKEFGVIIGMKIKSTGELCRLSNEWEEIVNFRCGNMYIAKESEHILKPKEGDLVTDGDLFGKVCSKSPYEDVLAFSIDDEGATRVVRGSEAKTIMRDNKQFFMPEVEND